MDNLTHSHAKTKAQFIDEILGDWPEEEQALKDEQLRLVTLYANRIWETLGAGDDAAVNLVSYGCDTEIACVESWCMMPYLMIVLEGKYPNIKVYDDTRLKGQEMQIDHFEVPQPEIFKWDDQKGFEKVPAWNLRVVRASSHWQYWPLSSSATDWFWVGPYSPISPHVDFKIMEAIKELL